MALARADAKFQPIYVGDVAECIVRALGLPVTVGRTFPLCGPTIYTLRELVRYAGEVTGRPRPDHRARSRARPAGSHDARTPAGNHDEP
jgi:NADH dehydrogenase